MQKILLLLLIVIFSGMTVQATTYSCRDKQGTLFITDNLQALPTECQGQARRVESKDPDNLNYVPAQADPQGSGDEFQQVVRDAELEQRQKQAGIERLLQRAKQLAEQYRQAVQKKNNATRRWSYDSRDIIQTSEVQIGKSRDGKQQLLTEMSEQQVSQDDEQKIISWLDKIAD